MEQATEFNLARRIITIVIMILLWAFCFLPLLYVTRPEAVTKEEYILDEGWNVELNGEVYENVSINEFRFPVTQKGDVIVLTKKIPEDCKIKNPFLCVLSVHSTMEMYLDDELFYEFGQERYKKNLLIGYGKSSIPMPEDYYGKELKVVFGVTENSAFDGFQAFSIVDASYYFKNRILLGRVGIFISIFLIGFGCVGMALSVIAYISNKSMVQVFCMAMFALLVGIWTLCNDGLMEIIVPNLWVKSYFEYISLYMAPLPLTYYVSDRIREGLCPKWIKGFFWSLVSVEVGFVVISTILQVINVVHLPQVLVGSHIIFGITVLFYICFAFSYIKNAKKVRKSILVGFGLVAILAIFEIVMFNVRKYIIGFENNKYTGTLFIIAFIIVLALFFDYMERMHTAVYEAAQKKLLENLAYMDELTGLANRRKIDDTLLEHKEKSLNYAVVSLDMNSLKLFNDTYGHDKGDQALRRVASCLVEVFEDHALVGRMGGDEFALVVDAITPDELDQFLIKFDEILSKERLSETNERLTCAYGYAFSYECSMADDAYAIYRKADARMYDNKRAMKMAEANKKA